MGDSHQVRVTCPHNCYDTCSALASVVEGVVQQVDGDPGHPHTQGRLCSKGYRSVERLYAQNRLRHPLIQEPRGSGRWRRLTWDEALTRIGSAIIDLHDRFGSLLPVCLYQGSGNLGLLRQAPQFFFRSMGPITEAVNTLCSVAGFDAQTYDFGAGLTSDPEEILNAKTILLWGVNPAWTAPHQMRLVMQAQDRGAKVITIDPVVTATASRSDLHLPIRPGTDGALALGMARHLLETGGTDQAFLAEHTLGWDRFRQYLMEHVTVEWAASETGLEAGLIREAADRYAGAGPSLIWVGYGLQRYRNGGQSVRTIDALAALTGQIGQPGTGVQFGQTTTLSLFDRMWGMLFGPTGGQNRRLSMGDLPSLLTQLAGPPVRMLWVTGANPMAQGPDRQAMRAALGALDLVVVVDQFMTQTAAEADILLPATTYLEQADLNVGYWHHDISVNERAVPPLFEARSDLSIAQALSRALNRLRPGFCPFPSEGSEEEWLSLLWSEEARKMTGLDSWEGLRRGALRVKLPRVAWEGLRFATPSGRFELWAERASVQGLPALPVYVPPGALPDDATLRLLTPHSAEGLNSQFLNLDPGYGTESLPVAEIHPEVASSLGLTEGDRARLSSQHGALKVLVRLTRTVPADCVVVYSGTAAGPGQSVNALTEQVLTDMGGLTAERGVAFSETFVTLDPLPEEVESDAAGFFA